MKVLSAKGIKGQIQEELKSAVDDIKEKNVQPTLAVVLVGDDPASAIYVKGKQKDCELLGIKSILKQLPQETTQKQLLDVIGELNEDSSVNGILCQVPLPDQCDEAEVMRTILPEKDVDCFHPYNVGLLTSGKPNFMPCTPFGILQILKRYGYDVKGKNVTIIGRSNIVGRPLSVLLSLKGWDATVTVCHSRTEDIKGICQQADILVAAIGRAKFVTADFVKKGAILVDVGMNRIDDPTHPKGSRLVGDIDYEGIKEIAEAATPVPGGVGVMTRSMLMFNTINAARLQNGMDPFEI
jgi:methylenetetrahydrofolate dehydrogenase (NADP+) / methenyltetrahydrofolate cyclohydrolase